MHVDAFTCCVGPVYASYLQSTLSTWLQTLDSLTVVTRPDDAVTIAVCQGHRRLRLVTTDVLTAHGAHLNKGAALDVAYAAMDPMDVVLHFDADILPPLEWREQAEKLFRPGYLFGCKRQDELGKPIYDGPPPWHGHCGNYDIAFNQRWKRDKRAEFSFTVTHFGEVRQNWFGVGHDDPAAQNDSFCQMLQLHQVGLHIARIRVDNNPKLRLPVPPYKLKLCLEGGDQDWRWQMLRACMTPDPFLVSCHCGLRLPDEEPVSSRTSPNKLWERIQDLYRTKEQVKCVPS